MKKILLLMLVASFFISGCVQLDSPKVKYIDYRINKVTTEGVEVNFFFDVTNKNPMAINVNKYTYNVYINNKKIIQQTGAGFRLEANAKNRITLPVLVRYEGIFGATLSIIESLARGEKSMDYRIDGTISAGAMGLSASSPINASGKLTIPSNIKIN